MTRNICAVGAGAWGQNIVQTLDDMHRLGGIVEPDDGVRDVLENRYPKVPVFSSIEEIPLEGIEGATVATPAPTHFAVARDLLLRGLDVFVEKPMTLAPTTAETLVRIAEDQDRVLMVGHMLVHTRAIRRIEESVHSGEIGEIVALHQERSKLGRVRSNENVLWSFGVHDLAVFHHLLGEDPDRIEATGVAVLQEGIEDDVHVHLSYPSGPRAHLHVSWLWPRRERRLLVQGDQGSLVYDEEQGTLMRHRYEVRDDLSTQPGATDLLLSLEDEEPLRTELEHFVESLESRETPITDGQQGVAVVRTLREIEEQIR